MKIQQIILFTFLLLSSKASAQIYITEINYDPVGTDTKREWIEVYNSGEDISIDRVRFVENDVRHGITGDSSIIPSNTYVVFASDINTFKLEHEEGLVFDSVFGLVNTGERLVIEIDGEVVDEVTYEAVENNFEEEWSLQLIDGNWIAEIASPFKENIKSSVINKNISTHSSQGKASKKIITKKEIETDIGRERIAYPHIPISFEILSDKELGNDTDIIWSFGDGSKGKGLRVSHGYIYPGEYVVTARTVLGKEMSFSRTRVNVLEQSVQIKDITNEYIEIENINNHEVNIGKMRLVFNNDRYTIPQDTILLPHVSIKFPVYKMFLRRETDVFSAKLETPKRH